MFDIQSLISGVRPFNNQYRCFSVSMVPGHERDDLEHGGKIILPPSALDQLTRLHIMYPMLFKISNNRRNKSTHCGVLEFVADEGKVYIPYWMMQNLTLEEGGLLQVESASLPVATFAKFQPHSTEFLDMTNPKAVLEARLRNFACLSTGDVIAIMYNNKIYELSVLETKPSNAVSVIECDLNVDFAPPVGYQDPSTKSGSSKHGSNAGNGDNLSDEEDAPMDMSHLMPEPTGFIPFAGSGNRLDGKKKRTTSDSGNAVNGVAKAEYVRGIPDYDYVIGTLTFMRNSRPPKQDLSKENDGSKSFEAFKGEGKSLRQAKGNKK